jgi:hypothetical protein
MWIPLLHGVLFREPMSQQASDWRAIAAHVRVSRPRIAR